MRVNVTNWAGACQISFNTVLKIVGHKLLLFNAPTPFVANYQLPIWPKKNLACRKMMVLKWGQLPNLYDDALITTLQTSSYDISTRSQQIENSQSPKMQQLLSRVA